MSDDSRHDGLADVINLLAAPIAGGIRTVEQLRRGIDEAFRAIDNLNTTIENLNEAATRINRFMAVVEPAVLALLPQITRTVQTADEITSMLEGPVRATAPNVEKIVNALGSPGFLSLPIQFGELMQRLTPLAQLAENAGGLFGGFRLPGMGRPAPTTPRAAPHSTPAARRRARPPPATRRPRRQEAGCQEGTPPEDAGEGGHDQVCEPAAASALNVSRDERRGDDGAGQPAAAHVDSRRRRRSLTCGVDEGQGDPVAEHRREVARRDHADRRRRRRSRRSRCAAGDGPRWRCRRDDGRRRRRARRAAPACPRNSGLSKATTHASPACSGVMPGPNS